MLRCAASELRVSDKLTGEDRAEMISGMERNDIEALAATIGNLLAAVEAHTLDASQVDRERLVGALVALRIVLGDEPTDVLDALRAPTPHHSV